MRLSSDGTPMKSSFCRSTRISRSRRLAVPSPRGATPLSVPAWPGRPQPYAVIRLILASCRRLLTVSGTRMDFGSGKTSPRNPPAHPVFCSWIAREDHPAGRSVQYQVEQTVAGVSARLGVPDLDAAVCYQSRATPQVWISPSTEAEIERAAHDKVAVLVVPIAFVSEHSETLVELDVEYRELAERLHVPGYFRVPTQKSDAAFIASLADLVRAALARGTGTCSSTGRRICPAEFGRLPVRRPCILRRSRRPGVPSVMQRFEAGIPGRRLKAGRLGT